jgi:hypothetical protein
MSSSFLRPAAPTPRALSIRDGKAGRRWPRHSNPDWMIDMSKASAPRLSIPGLMFWLFAASGAPAGAASPAPAQFDGTYRGTFTLTAAPGFGRANPCDESKIEQVMSVSGSQVYLDRKSIAGAAPLLLSGTISADGSVSAAGITPDQKEPGRSIFFTLTGTIENSEFTGKLSNRGCFYNVKMKR